MNEVTIFEAQKSQVTSDREQDKKQDKVHNQIKFYGQHEDERILYEVRMHPFTKIFTLMKYGLVALMLLGVTLIIGQMNPDLTGKVEPWGLVLGGAIMIIGWMTVRSGEKNNVAYITDRRVVRFRATSPFSVNSRSLSWDEAVKVKTYSPSTIFRWMNIGTVVIHAKSTVVPAEDVRGRMNTMTDDDVHLDSVHYYQDLGNYIDKILYLYKQRPGELQTIRVFVAKPRGKRD